MAMLLLGFASLGYAAFRRSKAWIPTVAWPDYESDRTERLGSGCGCVRSPSLFEGAAKSRRAIPVTQSAKSSVQIWPTRSSPNEWCRASPVRRNPAASTPCEPTSRRRGGGSRPSLGHSRVAEAFEDRLQPHQKRRVAAHRRPKRASASGSKVGLVQALRPANDGPAEIAIGFD